jgi:hypothetical protein
MDAGDALRLGGSLIGQNEHSSRFASTHNCQPAMPRVSLVHGAHQTSTSTKCESSSSHYSYSGACGVRSQLREAYNTFLSTMTFSFSAPRFTEADERYEQEHLTESERLEAWSDVYGKTNPLKETPEMLQSAQQLLEEELQNIPNKQAYLDAVAACPDVVRSESPALRFLRCEKYNAAVSHVCLEV